jgi:hypothetical protein
MGASCHTSPKRSPRLTGRPPYRLIAEHNRALGHGSPRPLGCWVSQHALLSAGELGHRTTIADVGRTIGLKMPYRLRRNCRSSVYSEARATPIYRRSNSCRSWRTKASILPPSPPFIACNAVWAFAPENKRRVARISSAAARSIAQSNPIGSGVGISPGCRPTWARTCTCIWSWMSGAGRSGGCMAWRLLWAGVLILCADLQRLQLRDLASRAAKKERHI